ASVSPRASRKRIPSQGTTERASPNARCVQELDRLSRELDRREEMLRVEVRFAGLVDDAQESAALAERIRKRAIDLPDLERDGIAVIADAEHRAVALGHGFSVQET